MEFLVGAGACLAAVCFIGLFYEIKDLRAKNVQINHEIEFLRNHANRNFMTISQALEKLNEKIIEVQSKNSYIQ